MKTQHQSLPSFGQTGKDLTNRGLHRLIGYTGVIEYKDMAAVLRLTFIIIRQRLQPYPESRQTLLKRAITARDMKPQQEMQTRSMLDNVQPPGSFGFPQKGKQLLPLASVIRAHAVDMLFKITLPDKPRQCILFKI